MTDQSVELPGVFLDRIIQHTPDDSVIVFNRDPEPMEILVPVGTNIEFDIATVGGDALDTSRIVVTINGVVAYTASGGFESGFNGSGSSVSNPDSNTTRIVIDPTSNFASLQRVDVGVVAFTVGDDQLNFSWWFIVADTTPPVLTKALAWGSKTIRAFSNKMLFATDTDNANSAINPSNWVIDLVDRPAMPVSVVSVSMVAGDTYDIELNADLTIGSRYRVTAINATDTFGNEFESPTNTVVMDGYVCRNAPADRDFNLYSMMPMMNRMEDESGDLKKLTGSIQDIIDLLLCRVDDFSSIADPDTAAELFLDLMLNDLGNPFAFVLDENKKRRLIRSLVPIYKMKGTAPGVEEAVLFFLGLRVVVSPFVFDGWIMGVSELGFDTILFPSGKRDIYSFIVTAFQALTDDQRDGIRQIVDYMKPVHTHFVQLVEPESNDVADHLELGVSQLDIDWTLH